MLLIIGKEGETCIVYQTTIKPSPDKSEITLNYLITFYYNPRPPRTDRLQELWNVFIHLLNDMPCTW